MYIQSKINPSRVLQTLITLLWFILRKQQHIISYVLRVKHNVTVLLTKYLSGVWGVGFRSALHGYRINVGNVDQLGSCGLRLPVS